MYIYIFQVVFLLSGSCLCYKSGTTWLQTLVSKILFKEGPLPNDCKNVGDLSPWIDLRVPPSAVKKEIMKSWRRKPKTVVS